MKLQHYTEFNKALLDWAKNDRTLRFGQYWWNHFGHEVTGRLSWPELYYQKDTAIVVPMLIDYIDWETKKE